MLKTMIASIASLNMLVTPVGAATPGLKAAFDELKYSLTVEWDQQDQTFYDAQSSKFQAAVSQILANGLSNAEFSAFIKSEVKDARTLQEIDTVLNLVSLQKMTADEAHSHLSNVLEQTNQRGANWNGKDTAAQLLVVGFISFAIWAVATGKADFDMN